MDKQWCTFNILRLSTTHNGYKTSKICLKLQIPYYHELNVWLLGATTSAHPSVYPSAHLHTPPCTSAHDSDWLIVPTTTNHIPAFKNLINIKSWFFSTSPPHPSTHLHAPLHAPLHTSTHLSAPLHTPLHTSAHLCAPLRTPPCMILIG